jgi:hypothetical protein
MIYASMRILERSVVAGAFLMAAMGALAIPEGGGLAAQETGAPSTGPQGRNFSPGQLGAVSSPQRFLVSSSANDGAAYLWIIDAVERSVTLCEKAATAKDFTCSKKNLP